MRDSETPAGGKRSGMRRGRDNADKPIENAGGAGAIQRRAAIARRRFHPSRSGGRIGSHQIAGHRRSWSRSWRPRLRRRSRSSGRRRGSRTRLRSIGTPLTWTTIWSRVPRRVSAVNDPTSSFRSPRMRRAWSGRRSLSPLDLHLVVDPAVEVRPSRHRDRHPADVEREVVGRDPPDPCRRSRCGSSRSARARQVGEAGDLGDQRRAVERDPVERDVARGR